MEEDAVADHAQLDRARADIADNIGQYADGWSSTEGGVVTKFVVLAEVVAPDGDKKFFEIQSDHLASWERAGFLHRALYE